MRFVNNPFGEDQMDIYEESEADRMGTRIRTIRKARGMSQAELGEKVGLNADRIQKYENGARKPKADMLKKIAVALDVRTLALIDPVTTTYIGAMFAFFEMERTFNIKVGKSSDNQAPGLYVSVDPKDGIYDYIEEWYKAYKQMRLNIEMASSEEEQKEILDSYYDWEWNFPTKASDKKEIDQQKKRIKKKIEELQEIYEQLDKDGE